MRLFFLENDPQIFRAIELLGESGYDVGHARNLQNAVMLLEVKPKASFYDLFFFDVELPSEEVVHFVDGKKVRYEAVMDFNGLLFLLHNVNTWGVMLRQIVIITAHKQRIVDMTEIDVLGKIFDCKPFTEGEEKARIDHEQITKIRYVERETKREYTLSFLDKGEEEIDLLIERFINRG